MRLEEDNIIRFGNVKFRIRELHPQGSDSSQHLRRSLTVTVRNKVCWLIILKSQRDLNTHIINSTEGHSANNNNGSNPDIALERNIRTSKAENKTMENIPLDKAVKSSLSKLEHQDSLISRDGAKCCRICLCDDEVIDDPMIQPCNCSGTMMNVHLKCFKKCVSNQILCKESEFLTSFYWKRLECELCKETVNRITNSIFLSLLLTRHHYKIQLRSEASIMS